MADKVIQYPEYWQGKKLAYPNFPPERGKYSRSVVVGNLIFISGNQGANNEKGLLETNVFEEQMWIALEKIKRAMEEAGSCMDNVIKTLILIKNMEDYPKTRATEFKFYQKYAPYLVENPPVSTIMGVNLGKPEYLIEIEVTGVISRG